MKTGWTVGIASVVVVVGVIILLHWVHVLPLPPSPPYYDGGLHTTITPTDPWIWFK